MKSTISVVALTLCFASPVCAQIVRGRITDDASGSSLRQASVVLLAPDGREVAKALSDTAGVFELRAPKSGLYQLRVTLLGFLPFTSERLDLAFNCPDGITKIWMACCS